MTISSVQKNHLIEKDFDLIRVIEYFSDHNINAQDTYNWLLNDQINANSIFLLGYFDFVTSENERAINLFINASEKNHTLAQFFVGSCYENGYGTIKDEKLAFEYYEKAANKNYATAQSVIGYCYEKGTGIKRDLKMAFYWYEKASNNGNIIAKHNLGVFYRSRIGIKKDYSKAFELFKQSADGGYSGGITVLGDCYSNASVIYKRPLINKG
ncbi:kinase-like domain-containing protein [Rhizophagus clarus]|uniref:Kinase-like domain-containing protein n=1 Tax=Rhizophagus clarus TaxID=94130 RepID=A0A8H3R518_9GLOM|nr:kinase-like domain-containing protein [Rhizophagus clarus]